MKRKIRKRCIATVVILFLGIILYKCVISGHSMPIFKANAISEYRTVTLGGVTQSILIRGENRTNPILLYIHGGPGDPETPFITPYQREWEKSFTVVNWDQRGSGKSYSKKIDRTTLTTERICLDAIELTEYLREQFHTEKIYLMGHSYGTYVGMKCIQKKPEYYQAYIGTRLMKMAHTVAGGEKNIAVYLVANSDAVPFYEKLGMKRSEEVMEYNQIDWTEFTVE